MALDGGLSLPGDGFHRPHVSVAPRVTETGGEHCCCEALFNGRIGDPRIPEVLAYGR